MLESPNIWRLYFPLLFFLSLVFITQTSCEKVIDLDLNSEDPQYVIEGYKANNPKFIALIEHEFVHFKRIEEVGFFKWYLLYAFNPKFRLKEELLGYKKQIKMLRENNIKVDIDDFARILSSFTYLNMVSKDKAKSLLSEL